jgi:hypothetical protein
MFKLTITPLKYFVLFFLSYLTLIWQILWRTALGLMMLTAIALFIEGLEN